MTLSAILRLLNTQGTVHVAVCRCGEVTLTLSEEQLEQIEAGRKEGLLMWILTENGDLVNLDQVKRIGIPWRPDLDRNPETEVKAWEAHYDAFGVTLCTCENEEYGRAIIEQLAHEINAGKRFVYISDVKKQAGVPLGDGEAS